MLSFPTWTPDAAADLIRVPGERDDKYTRGVLGVITGSTMYPGAAVLGVEAALHTGVGMVRYLGPQRAAGLVLQSRPEAVTADGRVQAWLLGSGMDHVERESFVDMERALAQPVPVVLDGGALDLYDRAHGPVVVTPHYRELARVLGASVDDIAADPAMWSRRAADELGVTVLLKGHTTYVCGAGFDAAITSPTTWLATAGAGDALAGILGALVATHAGDDLGPLAATAALIHGHAAHRASRGGPFTILGLANAIPATIAELLSRR